MIRVVVADDQRLVREGLRAILDAQPDITVVAIAADGAEAITAVRKRAPDVVLMDVRMPGVDGIAATERITRSPGAPRVLMLTTFDLDEHVYHAMRAGASGFLLKDAPPGRLAESVRTVAAGEMLLDPAVTQRLVERFVHRPPPGVEPVPGLDALSAREREVLSALARGLSNAEIASGLHLSPATVKTHVASVLHKLGLRDRVQAVVLAYETGIAQPGHLRDDDPRR